MRAKIASAVCLLLAAAAIRADWLDDVNRALSIKSAQYDFQLQLTGLADFEGYYIDQRPPGLINSDDSFLFNPRLRLFLDAELAHEFYTFVQARVDRGFDPSDKGAQFRLDEYFLRYTPLKDSRLGLQIGKFATVIGNWVPRHDSWQNPLINAPLPYENITTLSDSEAPSSQRDFGGRRFQTTEQYERIPIIWGPSYTAGAAVLGSLNIFDYAFEIKNAALSSHPETWQPTKTDWSNPTFSGRLGFRPGEAWNFGISGSVGTYMVDSEEARETLPPGKSIGDFKEYLLGQDAAYSWRHLQLFSEIFLTRFDVPRVGAADTLAYYVEGRYKITPQLFAALRWNQQFYGNAATGDDREGRWGNPIWRVDAGFGYRFNDFTQTKIQYSFSHQDAAVQQGEQLIAVQLTIKL